MKTLAKNMVFVRRYKDMDTNLLALYKEVVSELQNEKELNIGTELSGDMNGIPFMSVTAQRANLPKALTGTLREVTITITGKPNDYLVELHTGAWLSNLIVPGTGAFLIAGPVGAVAAGGATALFAVNYQRTMKNKLKKLIKKHSKKPYSDEKVETFG
jgi:hypothetical protein